MKRIFLTLLISLSTAFALSAQEYHLGQVVTNPDGSQGVVFYLNEDNTSGWMVALHDAASICPWGPIGDIDGLDNVAPVNSDFLSTVFLDYDGFDHTQKIRTFCENTNYYSPCAANVMNFDNGWYLPSAGQLKWLYVNAIFYEQALKEVGEVMGLKTYWSSSVQTDGKAWGVMFGAPYPMEHWAWNAGFTAINRESMLDNSGLGYAVRAIRNLDFSPLPIIGILETPAAICYQNPLDLVMPTLSHADTCGWEIAEDPSFSDPIAYSGQDLDASYDGWYLRFWASNEEGTRYSNVVTITVEGIPTSEIHGQQDIYYFINDVFTYSIDTIPDAYGYEWHIDNGWPLNYSPDSPQCEVRIFSKGQATLSVRVYTKCGFFEKSILIRHDLEPGVIIYPNPNFGKFNIQLFGLEGRTLIEVHNYLGQLIDQFEVQSALNGLTIPYSLSGKAAGVYVVTITNGYEHYNKKVLKESGGSYGITHY